MNVRPVLLSEGNGVIASSHLRTVLGRFATGVAVVSIAGRTGPVGITVNSFTSVSLEPPLVLFCVHNRSRVRADLAECEAFAINVLGAHQENISRAFTMAGDPQSDCPEFQVGVTGVPLIAESIAYLECLPYQEMTVAERILVIGEVRACGFRDDAPPLVFFGSRYTSIEEQNQHSANATSQIPPDYGLVQPISIPRGESIPGLPGLSKPDEYDEYFRVRRSDDDLVDWTRTCLTVSQGLMADIGKTGLSPTDRNAILRGLIVAQAETLGKWLQIAGKVNK